MKSRNKSDSTPLDVGRPDAANREARLMRSAHEAFARGLESSLSACLQTETKTELKGIALTTAAGYRRDLSSPTCLISFHLQPRTERMIMHLDGATALTMLEFLLGGQDQAKPHARELTEIEWSLLEEVIRVVVRELGEAWRAFHAVEFEVESLSSDPAFLTLPESAQPFARLSFEIAWGEQTGNLEIVLPQSFFDVPVVEVESQEVATLPSPADLSRNFELLEDAKVGLEVLLQGPTMAFEALLALKTGQIVTFDYPIQRPLRATVNGAAPMTGHIVSARQKRAFQIERLPLKTTA